MAQSFTGTLVAISCCGYRSLFELSSVLLASGDNFLHFWSYVSGVPFYLDIHSSWAEKSSYIPFNGLVPQTSNGFLAHSESFNYLLMFLSTNGKGFAHKDSQKVP